MTMVQRRYALAQGRRCLGGLALVGLVACEAAEPRDAAPERSEDAPVEEGGRGGQAAPRDAGGHPRDTGAARSEAAPDAGFHGADAWVDPRQHQDATDSGMDAPSARFRAVTAIIERSCAYQRCHAGEVVGGGLNLAPGVDYHAALVGRGACGYDGMKLVEPYHPGRSWLMVKLTAEARPLADPYATYIYFDPPAGWDPSKRGCVDQTDDGIPLFGQRMPATAPDLLPDDELAIFRGWIAEGAPP
jgi:hypothetical protein